MFPTDLATPAPARRTVLVGLNGLRALAVIAVVLYHLGAPWLKGGFLGVDLFFVISGFLITTLLIRERNRNGTIGIKSFWARRNRRLLPALFASLLALMIYIIVAGRLGNLTVASLDLQALRGDGIATLLYVANWHLIVTAQSYFAQFSTPSPLIPTWSLAIEEQFYIFWPLAVMAIMSVRNARWRRVGIWVAAIGALASAIEMAWLFNPAVDPSRVYYGTDTRAFDLLVGAGLAFLTTHWEPTERQRRSLRLAGWPGVVVLAVAWVGAGDSLGMPRSFMYRGGFLFCAVVAAVVIASSVFEPEQSLAKALSLKPLAAIGIVSYGIYLWHWPIIVFMNPATLHVSGFSLEFIRIALIAVFTTLSYYLIEKPYRYGHFKPAVKVVGILAAIGVTVAFIFAGTSPRLVSPPQSTVHHFKAPVTLPGVGGLQGQTRISLSGPPLSASNPLRVCLFGDSMVFLSAPGLTAALESTNEVVVQNFSFQGWGTSTIPGWQKEINDAVVAGHCQIMLGTWSWDDNVALIKPAQYQATLRELVQISRAAGADGVVLLGFPKVGPPGSGQTSAQRATRAAGEAAWQAAAFKLARDVPGQAMFFPIAPSVERNNQFSAWLPPPDQPLAKKQQWLRVRRLDGVHLCIPGVDRWATALTRDMTIAFATNPASATWANGNWTNADVFTQSANSCPNDHPR